MDIPYRNVIVGGDVGVGTSTLAHNLERELGLNYISAGEISRQYHIAHKIPLWNKAAVPDEFEKDLDNKLLNISKNETGYVIDSHYAAWFAKDLKDVYKILLICDLDKVQDRVAKRQHTHLEDPKEVLVRMKQLDDKFKKIYSTDDYKDPKFYNLVIDTGTHTKEQTLHIALEHLRKQ